MNFIKIEEIRIEDLKPYEKNPRNNEKAVDFVAKSIKQFGFNVPLVIDKNNVIVCGHTRFLAGEKLKMEMIPCFRKEKLTEKQIKAFRIADNKVHERSSWDNDLLKTELKELQPDFELEDLGFLDYELDTIFEKEVNVDEFFQDKEIIGEKKKIEKVTCPNCGHEFETGSA